MVKVASSLLVNDEGKLLILKRSEMVKTYKGQWGVVAGYVEENEKPYQTAIKEIKEEVGLEKNDVNLVKQYGPVEFTDVYEGKSYDWQIYVFVFIIKKNSKINIDWEHIEKRWILPSEIGEYNTVPFLKEIVTKILL